MFIFCLKESITNTIFFFFFNDPAPPEIYTLSLHDALPISLLPVQFSATSHGPADARQTVAADWKPSAGQLALLPVQFSATSHGPADARQTVATWRRTEIGRAHV